MNYKNVFRWSPKDICRVFSSNRGGVIGKVLSLRLSCSFAIRHPLSSFRDTKIEVS